MIGDEGMCGHSLVLGVDTAALRALVQGSGKSLQLKASIFQQHLERRPALRQLMLDYIHVFVGQLAQTASLHTFSHGRGAAGAMVADDPGPRPCRCLRSHPVFSGLHARRATRWRHCCSVRPAVSQADPLISPAHGRPRSKCPRSMRLALAIETALKPIGACSAHTGSRAYGSCELAERAVDGSCASRPILLTDSSA